MESQQRQQSVEVALSQIVGDFGRKVSEDPIRLRNLLIDATGIDAMTLNAEINAVVSAAETHLLDSVTSGDVTERAEATQRLAATLGPEQAGLAGWATETWTSVLDTPSSRPGATLGGSTLDATALPSAMTGADATALPSASITSDATVLPGPTTRMPAGAAAGDGHGGGDAASGGPASGDQRRLVVIGAFVGLLVVVIAVIVLATRGGGDGEAEPSTSTVALADDPGLTDQNTSTTPPGSDTPVVTIAGVHPLDQQLQVVAGVDGQRSLTPGERFTTVELMFTNSSGAPFEGFWLEAAPAEFGRDPLDIHDPNAIELGDVQTAVFAVPLSLADGETTTVAYTTSWIPADGAELETVSSGFDRALQGWIERNGDPLSPSIAMTSASTSPESTYTLAGVTEPMNSVTIDGADIDVASDGSFLAQAELAPGATTFEMVATSPLGVSATAPATVTFDPPVPDPTAPPVTDPPANAAPELLCSDDYLVFEGYYEGYYYGEPENCFSDPDGERVLIYSDIGEGAIGECGDGYACWLYRVPADWDGTPFEATAQIWAEDAGGLRSKSLVLTLCLNCTP